MLGEVWPAEAVQELSHRPDVARVVALGTLLAAQLRPKVPLRTAPHAARGMTRTARQATRHVTRIRHVIVRASPCGHVAHGTWSRGP